jgi:hypothetical protein
MSTMWLWDWDAVCRHPHGRHADGTPYRRGGATKAASREDAVAAALRHFTTPEDWEVVRCERLEDEDGNPVLDVPA